MTDDQFERWKAEREVDSVKLSNGEKLILKMLCELYEHLKVQGDIDPKLVESAICYGHSWALRHTYPGIFGDEERDPAAVSEVFDILGMYRRIQQSYERLTDEEKQRVQTEAGPFSDDIQFDGFDARTEKDHLSIAQFAIKHFGQFPELKVRSLDSHHPTLVTYRRMLSAFKSHEVSRSNRDVGVVALIRILKGEKPPVPH